MRDYFYKGPSPRKSSLFMEKKGGFFTAEDLAPTLAAGNSCQRKLRPVHLLWKRDLVTRYHRAAHPTILEA